jgi:hypothetical protein
MISPPLSSRASGVIPEHWPSRGSSDRANDGRDVPVAVLLALEEIVDWTGGLPLATDRTPTVEANAEPIGVTRLRQENVERPLAVGVVPPQRREEASFSELRLHSVSLGNDHRRDAFAGSSDIPEHWPSRAARYSIAIVSSLPSESVTCVCQPAATSSGSSDQT